MAAGVLVILGTAGASDMGNISLWSSLLQVLGGFCLLLAGYGGWRLSVGRTEAKKSAARARAAARQSKKAAMCLAAPAVSAHPAACSYPSPAGTVSGGTFPRRIA